MSLYKKFHAWALAKFNIRYEKMVSKRKRRLFADLEGTVVEIGPGTGPNFKFYQQDISWIGIEPNEYAYSYIRREAAKAGLRSIIIRKTSDSIIPISDNSVDTVVSTLVLCTVPSLDYTISEIYRILKPGGKFIFLEHVAAPKGSLMRAFQTVIKPFWKIVADGCNPDRETLEAIQNAGFSEINSESFKIFNTFVSPHIAGVARK
jgi:ubiquinone/menaquinone biosynthesis C-methylase UbiE